MTLSLHDAAIPVFLRALENLRGVLRKGEAHAAERGIAPEVLLQTRLIPDMFPLVRQVQIATDMVKNAAGRLSGETPPVFVDDETDFAGLDARIERAMTYLRSFTPERFADAATREIRVPSRAYGELKFDGRDYLFDFVLPNLYFHSSMAYAILRESGVPLGKADFLGALR